MHRFLLSLCLPAMAACAALPPSSPSQELVERVTAFQVEQAVPAVGAVVVSSEQVHDVAVAGTRQLDRPEKFTQDDPVHIGSLAKTMTAMIAAMLVEEGVLRWDTRLDEIFPFAGIGSRAAYGKATLADLLSHQAGIMPLVAGRDILEAPVPAGPPEVQRRAVTHWLLAQAPVAEVGREFVYSNASFIVAATMLEEVTGSSWEQLVRTRIFEPIGMQSAGFGWPGRNENKETVGVPWGHYQTKEGWLPVAPDGNYRLPDFLAPAGDVHASLHDMARYAAAWLAASKGNGLLKQETVSFMLTRRDGAGLGWGVMDAFGFDRVANFIGSAETFLAMIIMIPEADRAVLLVSNAWSRQFEDSMLALMRVLVADHVPDTQPGS